MNWVEREALEDPFVAQALEGLSASPQRSLESLSLLQKQLQDRITVKQEDKKTAVITWQRLSIAAAAAVIFISAGIIFWMKDVNYQESVAKQKPKKVEVSMAPKEFKDSILQQEPKIAAAKAPLRPAAEQPITTILGDEKPKAQVYISAAEPAAPVAEIIPDSANIGGITATQAIATVNPQIPRNAITFSSSERIAVDGQRTITGKITDAATGQPIPQANISGTSVTGSSDNEGNFVVTVPENVAALTFSSIGYESQRLPLSDNSLTVALKEAKNNNFGGVVVRDYQKRSTEQTAGSSFIVSGKEVQDGPVANVEQLLQGKVSGLNIQNAQPYPQGGWQVFKAYLIKENRFSGYIKAGQVAEFKFEVNKNGKPANIQVVRGLSGEYDSAAKQLILSWRKWSVPSRPVPVTVVLEY